MKSLPTIFAIFRDDRMDRINLRALTRLLLILLTLVIIYSVLFHILMLREGQDHTWLTGLYWTLTVMSTLGFGDITFHSDIGRLFSVVVLVTGVVFLLVLLPFTFIEFFYAPYIKAQERAKAPTQVAEDVEGHVIMTNHGPVARSLIRLLDDYGYPHFVLSSNLEEALELQRQGVPVVLGDWTDPDSFRKLNVEMARMVVTTLDDVANTNITFTARELSDRVTIVASASTRGVRDALELAGVTHIIQLEELMGETLARRVIGNDAKAHVIGELGDLLIAETGIARTSLPGKTVAGCGIFERTGMVVVGRWERGNYHPTDLSTPLTEESILLLAGTEIQVEVYNEVFGVTTEESCKVIIIGGGRVGRALSRSLTEAGIAWTIIEKIPARVQDIEHKIIGNASEFEVLVEAGMRDAASVIITTHDDPLNTFLTIFYRRLRNDLQIISRCTQPQYASRLHRAGADLVLSYASMGANTIFTHLRGSGTVPLGDGVNVFTTQVPSSLAGVTIAKSEVRSRTGCSIIALETGKIRQFNPGPEQQLPEGGNLVLVGSLEAEREFLSAFEPETKS
ncbi:potassium channel family protein [Haloferula chungangensis]|uniref:Potassium channel family protein n=1 Tax=Haloferula chungangensis TaxID=1048331 RepID=A0ABW2L994_9BACT